MKTDGTGICDNSEKRGSARRVSQFSYIRVIACFAIVLLHCVNTARVYHEAELGSGQINAAFTVCAALMWAVPCFLMVSGALLLDPDRKIPASKLFGKYIRRMAVALLVFTFIFTLIKYLAGGAGENGFFAFYMTNLLRDQAMPHLWYLYLMIALYLALPLCRLLTEKASEKQLVMTVCAVLLIVSVLPLLSFAGAEFAYHIPTWLIYPAYLFIGHLLYGKRTDARAAAAVFVICTAALAALTCGLMRADIDPSPLNGYNSPLVVMQSAAAFSLMLNIKRDAGSFISDLDSCTFGIYLIHMIFVRIIMKDMGFDPFRYGPLCFIGMAIAFFFASYAVTHVIRRFTGSAIV